MSAIPAEMNALIVEGPGKVALKQVPTPKLFPGTVIVKVSHVALNPTDWKHLDFLGSVGSTLGSDFSGTVVAVGEGVDGPVALGDRVSGTVHGGAVVGQGAFAEYVLTIPTRLTALPDDMSDSDAAGLGVAGMTAIFALFQEKHLGLTLPSLPLSSLPPVDSSKKLLVWSGASSVGQFTIQLGRLAGYYVIATSSPKNFDWIKDLGASETYSYADESTPEKIAEAHPDLAYAFDTFSEKGSQEACARALSKNGGKLAVILPPSPKVQEINSGVKTTFVLLYTTGGKAINMLGASFDEEYCKEDAAFAAQVQSGKNGIYYKLLTSGLKPNRPAPKSGGLAAVPEGLDLQRSGKVSGEKLLYAI
ncbi:hypothetical protein MCUN1_003860 [Malassezia cuniculi]|uniref:Enoyl reductase (ER) domain-containing protein n=1 Tax=Malassezia cuniculi TaxID=948313 RepID=A0AAF0F2D7_9BASI|nr:hypothetical protein MCUN1_003860 [Malassezia cuniculi]